MNPQSVPYREGKNIVIYDAKLMANSLKKGFGGANVFLSAQPDPIFEKNGSEHFKKMFVSHNTFSSAFLKDFIRGASVMCIFLALLGVILTISPILYAEIASKLKKKEFNNQNYVYAKKESAQFVPGTTTVIPLASEPKDINLLTEQAKISWLYKKGLPTNLNWDFTLLIPKISLNSKVFPNVDPSNKEEYLSVLKNGVAHAKFTAFPGTEGLVYIFGHSTDFPWNIQQYNALFYDIKDLKEGDEIIVLYNNKPYVYKTLYQKIIDNDNLVYLNSQTNAKMLVLQTCWPPGTTWKRLIVVAQLVEETSL